MLSFDRHKYRYFAISGAGGIGKTTILAWLKKQFAGYGAVVTLPDYMSPPNLNWPIEEIVIYLAHQKLARDAEICEYVSRGALIFCDRTCLDPLALAMTLSDKVSVSRLEQWYNVTNFTFGHHILLKAPHSVIKERRILRGSSPRTTWLKGFDISQEEYEDCATKHLLYIHKVRGIPIYEVDFSSIDSQTNIQRLVNLVKQLLDSFSAEDHLSNFAEGDSI